MKKITGLMLCLLLAVLCAAALADLEINEENFPGEAVREYALEQLDSDGDGILSDEECARVEALFVGDDHLQEVLDYFPNLSVLWCEYCPVSSLDVSRHTALTVLNVRNCGLNSLILGKNSSLRWVMCCGNNLSSLDISGCSGLLSFVKGIDPVLLPDEAQADDGNFYGWWQESFWYQYQYDNCKCLLIDEGLTVITDKPVSVTAIELNRPEATMTCTSAKPKPTLQLRATVSPENATDPSIEWTSSNPKVAKVNQNGKVTALKKGTAIITCQAKDGSEVKATCKITVKNKLVSKIILNKTKATIKKGKTLQLQVKTVKPANALNKEVKWRSSNKKIATVNKDGKVKALKKGTCYIICAAKDGSGVKVKCKITVK